jgi:hypothetical protein
MEIPKLSPILHQELVLSFEVFGNLTNSGVANASNEFEKLDLCTGTNYYCDSETGANICNDPTLVLNIGSPSVVNDYGAATANPTSPSLNTVIRASANARPTSNPNSQSGSQPVPTAGSSMSTSTATAIGSGIGTAALVGIIVGVVFLIGLGCVGAGVFLCIRRSQRRKAAITGNLIDVNPSHNASGASTAAMLPTQPQTQGVSTWAHSPQSQVAAGSWVQTPESPVGGWENQAEYYVPHYQQTPTVQGQKLVELHTAVSPPPTKERFSVAELP